MSFGNDFSWLSTNKSRKVFLRVEKGVYHVESYTIPYAMLKRLRWRTLPAQKEATYYARVNLQSDRWTGSILGFSTYDLNDQHRFLHAHLLIFKISFCAKVVTSRYITATSELISAGCNHTRLASDLGRAHQSPFVRYIYKQLMSSCWSQKCRRQQHMRGCSWMW